MSIFVYVPFAEPEGQHANFDKYAVALVKAKNKYWHRYTLIERGGTQPLSKVKNGDRLYILIHGQADGMRAVYKDAAGRHTLTGAELADHLTGLGLADRKIDLRLFSCYSGLEGDSTDPNKPGRSTLVLELCSALRAGSGYKKMNFTGYTEPVLIDEEAVARTRKKRVKVGTKPVYGKKPGVAVPQILRHEPIYKDTTDFKVTIKAI